MAKIERSIAALAGGNRTLPDPAPPSGTNVSFSGIDAQGIAATGPTDPFITVKGRPWANRGRTKNGF